jgi:hypothetical protein
MVALFIAVFPKADKIALNAKSHVLRVISNERYE